MNWTQEQRDQLVKLWDHGKRSYSELAKIFGVSKNSIVGRMRREKELRGIEKDHAHAHRTRTNKVYQPREKKMTTLPSRAEFVLSVSKAPLLPVPDLGQMASIVVVTGCRWAVSYDASVPGGHLFCNHGTDEGQTYCPYHRRENVASYSRELIRKTIKGDLASVKDKAA